MACGCKNRAAPRRTVAAPRTVTNTGGSIVAPQPTNLRGATPLRNANGLTAEQRQTQMLRRQAIKTAFNK